MVRSISAKVGQGIILVFLHLLAHGNGRRESFDAGHVRYPFTIAIYVLAHVSPEVIRADIQTRQRPDDEMNIRGRTQRAIWHLLVLPDGVSESSHA